MSMDYSFQKSILLEFTLLNTLTDIIDICQTFYEING